MKPVNSCCLLSSCYACSADMRGLCVGRGQFRKVRPAGRVNVDTQCTLRPLALSRACSYLPSLVLHCTAAVCGSGAALQYLAAGCNHNRGPGREQRPGNTKTSAHSTHKQQHRQARRHKQQDKSTQADGIWLQRPFSSYEVKVIHEIIMSFSIMRGNNSLVSFCPLLSLIRCNRSFIMAAYTLF